MPAEDLLPASDGGAVDGFYQQTLDSIPAHIAVLDAEGIIRATNRSWRRFEATDGLVGETTLTVGTNCLTACRDPAAKPGRGRGAEIATAIDAILTGGSDNHVLEYSRCEDEHVRRFVLRAARFVGDGARQIVLQRTEVTALRAAEQVSHVRSRLLDEVDAAVVALDTHGLVTLWNQAAERLYGYSGAEVIGRSALSLLVANASVASGAEAMTHLRENGRWEGHIKLKRKDGSRFPAYVRTAHVHRSDGQHAGYVGVSIDDTAQLQAARDLRSARDYMRVVADSMSEALCTLDENGQVVYLNPRAEGLLGWSTAELVGKNFHDTLHHLHPDGTPKPSSSCPLVAARRSRAALRLDDDVLMRRTGDLVPVQLAQTPFETPDGVVGFVLVFTDVSDRKRRERDAEAKLRDFGWIERIRWALDNDRFVLYEQPIVEIASGLPVQHELLLRMLDHDGSVIAPGAFLPVAEAYGMIGEIDRWVVQQALALAATGRRVELNVSAYSLSDATFRDFVEAELRRSGADPALIVFELTETALLSDEQAALQFATAIDEHGCGLALDDFGTGYGTFTYLKRLPVDFLKIDIEFVRDLLVEPASRQVIDAVVNLARGFKIKTVAEGVEDLETLAVLADCGVDFAQGYALGRPAPLAGIQDQERSTVS